jgi:cytochrome P450 family 714 subfamily C
MVIESAKKSNLTEEASDRFIIDNCKNIYLVGFETTAVVALWCLMLLASNKNWQDCVRAEVIEVCRGRIPNSRRAFIHLHLYCQGEPSRT